MVAPHLRRRRSLPVKMDQRGQNPTRMSFKIGFAMKSPDLSGEM
jgi:hypothetical protein